MSEDERLKVSRSGWKGGELRGGDLVVKGCGVERSPTTFALHVDIGDGSKQVHDLVEALPGSEEHENERGGVSGP